MTDDLVKRWDEYVESMGCVMGEAEHMAQQMRDRIEELEAKLGKAVNMLEAALKYNSAMHGDLGTKLGKVEAALKLHQDLAAINVAEVARLTALLAKAVRVLGELNTVAQRAIRLSQEHDSFRLYGMEPMWQATAQATITLAELTGGKDDTDR